MDTRPLAGLRRERRMTDDGKATSSSRNEGKGQRTDRRLSIFKTFLLVALMVVTAYGMLNRGLFGEERWIPVAGLILVLLFMSLFVGDFYRDVPRVGWIL